MLTLDFILFNIPLNDSEERILTTKKGIKNEKCVG